MKKLALLIIGLFLFKLMIFAQNNTPITIKRVSNSTSRCVWDNRTVNCEKKSEWLLSIQETAYQSIGSLATEFFKVWYSSYLGELGILFGSDEDKQVAKEVQKGIFRLNLYTCPSFCSQKCEIECKNNNNCKY